MVLYAARAPNWFQIIRKKSLLLHSITKSLVVYKLHTATWNTKCNGTTSQIREPGFAFMVNVDHPYWLVAKNCENLVLPYHHGF